MNYMTEIEEDMWELFFKQTLLNKWVGCWNLGQCATTTPYSLKIEWGLVPFLRIRKVLYGMQTIAL